MATVVARSAQRTARFTDTGMTCIPLPVLPICRHQISNSDRMFFAADARSKLKAVADRETYGAAHRVSGKSTAKINW